MNCHVMLRLGLISGAMLHTKKNCLNKLEHEHHHFDATVGDNRNSCCDWLFQPPRLP